MPEAEAAHLRDSYEQATVILEYGSGGSTELAAKMPGKLIISVESDRRWAREQRQKIMAENTLSQVIVQHIDIGPTGAWGRAIDDRDWRNYHRYPNAVWEAPFFRHPDVILIDGRFRTACLMTALLRITRPVTVLFDDYLDRPKYQLVEKIIQPQQLIGRMAEFVIEPGQVQTSDMGFIIMQFFQATYAGAGLKDYQISSDDEASLKRIQSLKKVEKSIQQSFNRPLKKSGAAHYIGKMD